MKGKKWIILCSVVILCNSWIWVVFHKSVLLFFLLSVLTFVLYCVYYFQSTYAVQVLYWALIVGVTLAYVITSERTSLTLLDSLGRDLVQKRLNSYPSPPVPFIPGRISYKIPQLLEQSPLSIVSYKLQKNLTHFFDPNYYFFGNYPREIQIPGEFSKFPFFFLLFALIGIFEMYQRKKWSVIVFFVVINMIAVAVAGERNHLGLFLNFPLLVLLITIGMQRSITVLTRKAFHE